MFDLFVILTPIGLIDSASVLPFGVVVLAMLLSGPRPYVASIGFLLGTALAYLACGVLILLGLGELLGEISGFVLHRWKHPGAADYVLGFVIGVALVLFGYAWATARQERARRRTSPRA